MQVEKELVGVVIRVIRLFKSAAHPFPGLVDRERDMFASNVQLTAITTDSEPPETGRSCWF